MDKLAIGTWCLLSFTVSGFFFYHGMLLFSQGGLGGLQLFYALSGLVYGAYSAIVLLAAIFKPNQKQNMLAKYGVVVMLISQITFGLLHGGAGNLHALLTILVIVFMLSPNWLSVKYVLSSKVNA